MHVVTLYSFNFRGGGFLQKRVICIVMLVTIFSIFFSYGLTTGAAQLGNENPVNLGPQVFKQSTMAAKAGMDKDGNAYLYVVLHGNPSGLAILDLNTKKVVDVHKLSNSTSAWALDVDQSGILWVAGTNSGNLYSYNPTKHLLKDHGHILSDTTDTSIQDIIVDENYVYGVTAYGANVFKYNRITNKREFFLPTLKGKQYAKSIAVDNQNNRLYVGVGSKAELLRWDLRNNTKSSVPNKPLNDETYIEKMKLIDARYLVMKLYPSKKAIVYDMLNNKFGEPFNSASRGFSEKNKQTNEFYYSYLGQIYAYNCETGKIRHTKVPLIEKTEALSLDIIQLKKNRSTNLLTGLIDNEGHYFIFNPKTNKIKIHKMSVPPLPVDLHLLFESPDKRYIYVNGYMSGGLTRYDPIKNKGIQLNGISQLESAVFLNGKLYLGAYPGAKLLELNDSKSKWNRQTPKRLVKFGELGQERIPALVSHENYLFGGTYPQYSNKGGLLFKYDVKAKKYKTYKNYIENQSIITLHPYESYIYGGSSIHANYKKAKDGAKFFRFQPNDPTQKEYIKLPVKASLVMSLITGPDNNIWGAADGTIFSYNPENEEFKTVKIFDAISGRYGNVYLLVGKDGFIYGTIEQHLFKMDPTTMEYRFLADNVVKEIVQDADGHIYFGNKEKLYKYLVE